MKNLGFILALKSKINAFANELEAFISLIFLSLKHDKISIKIIFKTKVEIKNKIKLQISKIINPKITKNLKYLLVITAFNRWILVIEQINHKG